MKNFTKTPTRDELNYLVDKAADLIRTAVDYKFILVLLFLKRINDVWKHEKENIKKRLMEEAGLSEKEAERESERAEHYTFNIPKHYLWDDITADVKSLPERLSSAISEIAKKNSELQGVVNRIDFLEFARNQENRELLRQLVELFNKYDLDGGGVSPDVLGDAYEHILMKFAPQKAKEGEIYSPREVIQLMVEMMDPRPEQSIYDPCCGSGGMLILSYKHVEEKYGSDAADRLFIYGQEKNREIYAACQMNLILHGIKNAKLENGDAIDYPRFHKNGKLQQFDIVLSNPPWNQDGYDEERLKKADFRERYAFGYPPINSADWAWMQHMLASTKNGRVGVVIDNGCLFRGGVEKTIRGKIVVENDFLECVVLLPEKIFYNTGAPGAILIFNKNKPTTRKGKVLFINASEEYTQHPNIRRLNTLSKNNIEKIRNSYISFSREEGFSRVVDIKEIDKNSHNLNVTLYVTPKEQVQDVDIQKLYEELKTIESDRDRINRDLDKILKNILEATRYGTNGIS